ncbi:MAG: hypothetical protein KME54_07810 [Tolypothrix brevis GSE-NOS-MK-07-07A]|jgi:molybdopterin-biosynthesis enzyme MoeA-like protein|nr:hypothetical protein [Tolypothrix brevis GSE-NOS-MK-07-07A]
MDTSTSKGRNSEYKMLDEFKEQHIEEIQAIASTLVKITNLSESAVKPHLDAMLEQLVKSKQKPLFYETASAEEWIQALKDWSISHRRNTPLLSDYAVSRTAIYEDNEEI